MWTTHFSQWKPTEAPALPLVLPSALCTVRAVLARGFSFFSRCTSCPATHILSTARLSYPCVRLACAESDKQTTLISESERVGVVRCALRKHLILHGPWKSPALIPRAKTRCIMQPPTTRPASAGPGAGREPGEARGAPLTLEALERRPPKDSRQQSGRCCVVRHAQSIS